MKHISIPPNHHHVQPVVRGFVLALLATSAACYLRFGFGLPLRAEITAILGYDLRAVVEHALAGFGLPLMASTCLSWWPTRPAPAKGNAGGAYSVLYNALKWLNNPVSATLGFATSYSIIAICWESYQAYTDATTRDYLQYGQLSADIVCAFAGAACLRQLLK